MRAPLLALLLAPALAASVASEGCARAPRPFVELAVADAANANVTLAADGARVAAAWAATGRKGTDVYLAVSEDGGRSFGAPVRVNDVDGDVRVNGEAPPRVILADRRAEVVWVSNRGGVAAIRAAASSDGGATFAPARTITSAQTSEARGWQTAAFGPDGTVHVAWLDGRNASHPVPPPAEGATHAAHAHDGDMRQDIYHAMWNGPGAPIETQVASNVCFCCKTALASRADQVYVAWRHLFTGGVRDIAIARSQDAGRTFSDPVRVSADNWRIDACPDDGPALAIAGDGALHVAWPTMVTDGGKPRIGVFEAVSTDGGATFSPRTRVDTGDGSAAHPRVTLASDGRPAVVWDEVAASVRRVRLRIGTDAPRTVSAGTVASYPAIATARDGLVIAWTDQSAHRSVIRLIRADQALP